MTKNIEDFSNNTIAELIDAIDDTDYLELDRPAAFVTGTENHDFLYLNYSFDPDVFDLSDSKLDKATNKLEKDTGMPTWYERVDDVTVLVRIAVPRCDINVGEYFATEGTARIKSIYHEVVNA